MSTSMSPGDIDLSMTVQWTTFICSKFHVPFVQISCISLPYRWLIGYSSCYEDPWCFGSPNQT